MYERVREWWHVQSKLTVFSVLFVTRIEIMPSLLLGTQHRGLVLWVAYMIHTLLHTIVRCIWIVRLVFSSKSLSFLSVNSVSNKSHCEYHVYFHFYQKAKQKQTKIRWRDGRIVKIWFAQCSFSYDSIYQPHDMMDGELKKKCVRIQWRFMHFRSIEAYI